MRKTKIVSTTVSVFVFLMTTFSVARSDDTNPTVSVTLSGNLTTTGQGIDQAAPFLTAPTSFATLTYYADYSTNVDIYDSVHVKHQISLFFFKNSSIPPEGEGANNNTVSSWTVRGIRRWIGHQRG